MISFFKLNLSVSLLTTSFAFSFKSIIKLFSTNISIIYTPVYKKNNYYFDAILNRHICRAYQEDFIFEKEINWKVDFLPALCPKCGDYLEGKGNNLLVKCRNCNSFYYISSNGLEKIVPKITKGLKSKLFFPFWEFIIEIPKFNIFCFNDMLRLSGLPYKNNLNSTYKAHLIIPGFKMRPDLYLNLSARLSLHKDFPFFEECCNFFNVFPLTLPRKEAVSAIRLILAYMFKGKKFIFEELGKFKCRITNFNLIFIPFWENHLEFIQPQINFGMNKKLLSFFSKD